VVGNSSEIKNSILFNYAQVPHFNYIGDSVLGYKAHTGAGVKISNLKFAGDNIFIDLEGEPFDTGLRKFGALMGDHSEAGCNAVLSPGTILGRNALVYPNVYWRGILPANMIAKNKAAQEVVVLRPRSQ
jgi:NDP-sugar pyrophosphorylase family protein